eukprot:2523458-Amphidinium_carterae.1
MPLRRLGAEASDTRCNPRTSHSHLLERDVEDEIAKKYCIQKVSHKVPNNQKRSKEGEKAPRRHNELAQTEYHHAERLSKLGSSSSVGIALTLSEAHHVY